MDSNWHCRDYHKGHGVGSELMGILVGRVKHWGLRVRVKMTAKEQFSGWGLIVAQKSVPMFACF